MSRNRYIPALRFKILTPLIDLSLDVFMKGAYLRPRLVEQLNLRGNERVLDFGCGTGTLALMIKKACPGCAVTGIDVDPQVLGIAREKVRGTGINLVEYGGVTLPFADESFDRVVTSFVLHHLSSAQKAVVLKEIHRILSKGGDLHVLDFGVPKSRYTKIIGSFLKHLEPVEDNLLGKIPDYLNGAGFEQVEIFHSENTLLGTVTFYVSKKSQ
jgi:ubiquinone/menaquinone biosynthesis C-methylase UbiE